MATIQPTYNEIALRSAREAARQVKAELHAAGYPYEHAQDELSELIERINRAIGDGTTTTEVES